MLHSFTTKASSRPERCRQWLALTRADHVEFDDDREASLRGGEFGALRMCIVSMGRHRVVQSGDADSARSPRALKFMFQEEGSATIRQGGQSNQILPGQWCALRKDIPFIIDAPAHSRQLAITIPCDELSAPSSAIEWWRTPRSFLHGPARIVHASASASVMTGGGLCVADRAQLGQQITALAQMTIRDENSRPLPDVRAERRVAVQEFIDQHLAAADLGVDTIARAFGMSTRSIHKLFEGEATTISRIIWQRRLERCREEIVDPSLAAHSITEIAHLWGFSDSQHFSRAFRQRFGVSPRDYRNIFSLH
jgi:AraC-like DNA-binding protein